MRTKQLAGECVKLLQDRFNFERGDCTGTSDETLLAVAALAVFEVSIPTTILASADMPVSEAPLSNGADAHGWTEEDS